MKYDIEKAVREFDSIPMLVGSVDSDYNRKIIHQFLHTQLTQAVETTALSEVKNALGYMEREMKDGLSESELIKSYIRYLANRAMDLEAAARRGGEV